MQQEKKWCFICERSDERIAKNTNHFPYKCTKLDPYLHIGSKTTVHKYLCTKNIWPVFVVSVVTRDLWYFFVGCVRFKMRVKKIWGAKSKQITIFLESSNKVGAQAWVQFCTFSYEKAHETIHNLVENICI